MSVRKVQFLAVFFTLTLAVSFTILALFGAAYLTDHSNNVGDTVTGVVDWHSLAAEGSARWPELAAMIMGQLLILSILLLVRRNQRTDDYDPIEATEREQAAQKHDRSRKKSP
jgi:hypothetical protein